MRSERHTSGRSRTGRRGGAIAEFLLLAPTLYVVLMAIIEFGSMYSESLVLHQGAREGVRQTAIGKPLSEVRSRLRLASYSGVTDSYIAVEAYNTASSTWSAVTDSADGLTNAAAAGSLVRVRITRYPHTMLTGRFFSWIPNYSNGSLPLSAQMIMRRE